MATQAAIPTSTQSWVEHTADALRRAGYRSSGPRMAVVETLGRHDCVLTAGEIADRLRSEGRDVGVATVYRALELLEGLGLLHRLETGEGPTRYEPAHPTGEHHHHLLCERCGHVSAFEDQGVERSLGRLARRLDFRVEGHDLVLRGQCAVCAAESRSKAEGRA
ncbi:MAG: transcriptional repressor [Thermoleophilaceae bacterium]|jgi:Fur family ferric uptake transcriptional regulator|nr:transcriptional repressor [Thermoleophilaceae bacterium]